MAVGRLFHVEREVSACGRLLDRANSLPVHLVLTVRRDASVSHSHSQTLGGGMSHTLGVQQRTSPCFVTGRSTAPDRSGHNHHML